VRASKSKQTRKTMGIESTMNQLAKRAAEDKFEQFAKCEEEIKAHLQSIWDEWKPKFQVYDNADGKNAFKFRFGLPEELQETPETVLRAVFLSLDDFTNSSGSPVVGVDVFKWSHTEPEEDEQGGEGDCTVAIHFGHLANNLFEALMDEHQKKRRRTAGGGHSLEEALVKSEEGGESEFGSIVEGALPLSGFPDDGNPANTEFEELLQKQVFKFTSGIYAPTNQVEQVIEPGPCGRRNDIFEHKELFKRVTPRFFFNGEHKQWRRNAPVGWSGPVTAAEASA
jgi:hypothetical protein